MDKYLSDVKEVWPSRFDYREEIALQFLNEVLHYRDIDVRGGAVRENLVAFLNDLRLANRSHATLAALQGHSPNWTLNKEIISPK